MSDYEHLSPEQLELPDDDHEVMLALNGVVRAFNTKDTAMWQFKRFPMLNHIVQWHDADGSASAWYGIDEDDIKTLEQAGVTTIRPASPTITQLGHWWTVEMDDFDRELKQYAETGELYGTTDGEG